MLKRVLQFGLTRRPIILLCLFVFIGGGLFTLVSESGIRTRRDVERLEAAGVAAILVGEALMRADDIGLAVQRLLGLEPEAQETTASAQAAPA